MNSFALWAADTFRPPGTDTQKMPGPDSVNLSPQKYIMHKELHCESAVGQWQRVMLE